MRWTLPLGVILSAVAGAGACDRTPLDPLPRPEGALAADGAVNPGPRDAAPVPLDGAKGPAACPIVGRYLTNGGNIRELIFGADLRYSADRGRFVGSYEWDGSRIELVPGSGGSSAECPSRYGSSYRLTFHAACARIAVSIQHDNCTGAGLLTQTATLTRQ